jgi:hypothetical protein
LREEGNGVEIRVVVKTGVGAMGVEISFSSKWAEPESLFGLRGLQILEATAAA